MIIALKLLIVRRLGRRRRLQVRQALRQRVPPMVSNSPFNPFRWLKRAHYRDFPDDLRPSRLAGFMAHVGGTAVEIVAPLDPAVLT